MNTPKKHNPFSDKKEPSEYNLLRTRAKDLGINTHGMKKQDIVGAIKTHDLQTADTGEALGPKKTARIPLGARQPRLVAEKRKGYHRRFINDKDDRIKRAAAGGYAHVRDEKGEPISRPVGTQEHGGGMTAYLMEIPQNLKDEDFEVSQSVLDDIDNSIYQGTHGEKPGDKRYVPNSGIRIDVDT